MSGPTNYFIFVLVMLNGVNSIKHHILVEEKHSDISKRSALPNSYEVSFETHLGDKVQWDLKRNMKVDLNAPVTFEGSDESAVDANVDNSAVYQDAKKRAAISVTAENVNGKIVRTLEGSFIHNNKRYVIEPSPSKIRTRRSISGQSLVSHVMYEKAVDLPTSASDVINVARRAANTKLTDSSTNYTVSMDGENANDAGNTVTRKKRSSDIKIYNVEILVLLDHTIWERHMELANQNSYHATRKLKYHYAHIINGIDLAYTSIDGQTHGFTIDVWLKGFHIGKTKSTSPWTVNNIMGHTVNSYNQGKYRDIGISGKDVLNSLAEWHMQGGRTWYNPDHVMLFTRYNIGKSVTVGLAPLGRICTPGGNTLNEDRGFHSWTVAAHELGHNLGSPHDGTGNSCSNGQMKIMRETVGEIQAHQIDNVYTFSRCSINAMKKTIMGIQRDAEDKEYFPRVCLMNKVCRNGHTLTQDSILPGNSIGLNEQCKLRFGSSSGFCGANQNSAGICLKMNCKNDKGLCYPYYPGAAEGTPCGSNKWCRKGKCVRKYFEGIRGKPGCIPTTHKEIPKPADCSDDSDYTYGVRYPNKVVSYRCHEIPLLVPHVCYDKKVRQICCASCHKYGLATKDPVCTDVGNRDTYSDARTGRKLTCREMVHQCTTDKRLERVCCNTCKNRANICDDNNNALRNQQGRVMPCRTLASQCSNPLVKKNCCRTCKGQGSGSGSSSTGNSGSGSGGSGSGSSGTGGSGSGGSSSGSSGSGNAGSGSNTCVDNNYALRDTQGRTVPCRNAVQYCGTHASVKLHCCKTCKDRVSRCSYNGQSYLDISDMRDGGTGKICKCKVNGNSKDVSCTRRIGCNHNQSFIANGQTMRVGNKEYRCVVTHTSYGTFGTVYTTYYH